MKSKRAAAFFITITLLLTTAGCKYTKNQETTTTTTAGSSTAITTESTTVVTSVTETSTEIESEETSTTVVSSGEKETTSVEATEETEESTTVYKGFAFSTIVDLSSLISIDSYTREEILKQGDKFFDDAIFVGDSVTVGLKGYVTNERNAGRACLGQAQFLCEGSMGYINSYHRKIMPTYRGSKVTIEDGIKQSGAKKVFIMLGMNDFYGYGEGVAMRAAKGTIDNIIAKNPDVKIYIQSVTPILKNKQHDGFTNEQVDAFNLKLKVLCNEYGLTYVDTNSCMRDTDGSLKSEYCGDPGAMGIHMSYPGCKAWVEYLTNKF